MIDTSHISQSDIIQWCFDEIDLPELDENPREAKAALTDVIVDLNSQFAARKAKFEEDTRGKLPRDEFRQIRIEYEDWKRRTTYVKTAVEERLRQVKLDIHELAQGQVGALSDAKLVEHLRFTHQALGRFLDEIDSRS